MERDSSLYFNEQACFEERDGGYVFRPSTFARGYEVTSEEKDRLGVGLTRIAKRSVVEAVGFALIAIGIIFYDLFSSQTVNSEGIVILFLGFGAVACLALYRRDRLIARVLPRRKPDSARMRLKSILTQPRTLVAPRLAVPGMKLARAMSVLVLVLFDGLMGGVTIYSLTMMSSLDGDVAARAEATVSRILGSGALWVAFAGVNAILGLTVVMMTREIRKVRATMDGEGV